MPFPFVNKPFEPWVKKKLDKRNEEKIKQNYLTPFIFLTSGMEVSGPKFYQGCVISNLHKAEERYQLKQGFIGYDLGGEKIYTADGDALNRNLPPPIIESMTIDTDGGNNTLKEAKIEIRIFSQKQLDMFELFFLKAGINVVLEYGHNLPNLTISGGIAKMSNSTKNIPKSFLAGINNCCDFATRYVKFNHPDRAEWRAGKQEYLQIIEQTDGNYDFWTAKIINFDISFEASTNTYKVILTINSGNELQLWNTINTNVVKQEDGNDIDGKTEQTKNVHTENNYKAWITKLLADVGFANENLTTNMLTDDAKKEWEKHFYNFGIVNKKDQDNQFSKNPYISMKLIIHLMNEMMAYKNIGKTQSIEIDFITFGKESVIPMNSHRYLIASTEYFIIPGNLPKLYMDKNKKKLGFDPTNKQDCKINGFNFHLNEDDNTEIEFEVHPVLQQPGVIYKSKGYIGDFLKIFINYNTFVTAVKESITLSDFWSIILSVINENMLGLCRLQLQSYGDVGQGTCQHLTIVDLKLRQPLIKKEQIDPYRFKIGPNAATVIDFTYNLEMSALMQAQTIYQYAANKSPQTATTNDTSPNYDENTYFNLDNTPNIDGYKSTDLTQIELNALTPPPTTTSSSAKGADTGNKKGNKKAAVKSKENKNEKAEILQSLKQKGVRFKPSPTKNPPNQDDWFLIYRDNTMIQSYMKTNGGNSALTYVECQLTIDGMTGISCGELFQIDGVPETYNKYGAFQVMNTKQSVDGNGWRTMIDGSFRYNVPDEPTAAATPIKK